jgi:hypothetical protein
METRAKKVGIKFAEKIQKHTVIMRITISLLKSFGCALNVIFIIIKNTDFTLRDLTRRLRKEMRKSEPLTKVVEENPKRFSRHLRMVSKVTERTNDLWVQNLRSTGI